MKLKFTVVMILLIFSGINVGIAQDQRKLISFNFAYVFGSDGKDIVQDIVTDKDGNAILVGRTAYPIWNTGIPGPKTFYPGPFYDISPNFIKYPLINATDTDYGLNSEGIITKINPDGEIVFSTYWGGNSDETINSVDVDSKGNIIIVGKTRSTDLAKGNALSNELDGISDAFVSKLSPNGTVIFTTYLGGSGVDSANRVVVDQRDDSIIVVGGTKSADFQLKNAFDNYFEGGLYHTKAFISKFDSDGDLVFSTFFGGNEYDNNYAIDVDSLGNIYIAGITKSTDVPIINGEYSKFNGRLDGYIAEFSPEGYIIRSTFLGGVLADWIYDMKIDQNDNIYLVGYSTSPNFPVKDADDDILNNGDGIHSDIIIAKIDPKFQVVWATYYGGKDEDVGKSIDFDTKGNVVISGTSNSYDIYIRNKDLITFFNNKRIDQAEENDNVFETDVIIAKFTPEHGQLLFSAFYGGTSGERGAFLAMNNDNAYITGYTLSTDLVSTENNESLHLNNLFIAYYNIPEGITPPERQSTTQSDTTEPVISSEDPITQIILGITAFLVAVGIYRKFRKPKLSGDKMQWKKSLKDFYDKMNKM